MAILGMIAAVFMGAVLGLVGGGGSILTVPILVYILGISPVHATAYSLFVVGLSALVGSVDYIRRKLVDFKVGAVFVVPAFIGVYSVRAFLMPAIPGTMDLGFMILKKSALVMGVFSVIMILASYSMIKGRKNTKTEKKSLNYALVTLEGLVVGSITGFVGAGGGFLIIPALVVLAGLEIKVAVGTSLLIIATKSLLGFIGDVQVMNDIDWNLLIQFSGFSIVGIFIGSYFSRKISSEKLKPGFGWFVLVMGIVVLARQIL
ncbi:MAG: sulfite exporter TauE/SafE family protein [Bdellovibrionales bacterium]|nr:sulfite exporter TauE/SafE family protein [Bdellovibrionales bacterium]